MLSKKFWMTVSCFAVANIGAWLGYIHFNQFKNENLLQVIKFSPGVDAVVGARPILVWEFNLDIDEKYRNFPEIAHLPITIQTPSQSPYLVQGHWDWLGPRKLAFTPEIDLPKTTPFTFTLPEKTLLSKEGCSNSSFSVTVKTAPLEVISIRQAAFDERDQFMLEIEFNNNVLSTEALKCLKMESLDHQAISFHLYGESTGNVIRIITEPTPLLQLDHETFPQVMVHLDAGLCGVSGPLGLAAPYEATLVLSNQLMITRVEPYSSSRGKIKIRLYSNNNMDTELLKEVLSVEPQVPFTCMKEWFGASLEGDFIPGQRYALKISKPAVSNSQKIYPRSDLFSVFIDDREPQLWFEQEQGYLGSQGNRAVLAHAVNIENVKVIVTRMYENNIVAWRNTVYESRWYGLSQLSQVVAEKSLKLNVEKNKIQDIRLSLDELLTKDIARDGVYEIKIKPDQENRTYDAYYYLSASTVVTLSDVGLVAKQFSGGIFVWAISLATAKPMEKVRIKLFSDKNQLLGEALTDSKGVARIEKIEIKEDERPAIVVAELSSSDSSKTGLTWLDLRSSQLSYSNFDVSGTPYLRKGYEAFVYSERGAYRPGEKIHLWAIVRGSELTVPESFPVKWQFYRPEGREWKGRMVKMDSNGMSHLSMKLPKDIPTGRWSVCVGLPKSGKEEKEEFGLASFLVEEFVPNRMKMALKLRPSERGRYKLSDKSLQAKIKGDYLFGQPAKNGDATLTGRLDPTSFRSKKWKGWTFGDSAETLKTFGVPLPEGQSIELPPIKLDEQGKGKWELDLASLSKMKDKTFSYAGPWLLTVTGSVQEMGGRAVSSTEQLFIDGPSYYLALRSPVSRRMAPGSPSDFDVAAVTGQGEISKVLDSIEVKVFRETWNNVLTYRDRSYSYDSVRVLEEVQSVSILLKEGKGKVAVTPSGGGSYVVSIRDPKMGTLTSESFYVSEGEGWEDSISRERPDELKIKISPVRVGEKTEVVIRSPFPGTLLLTLETDHVIFHQVQEMTESYVTVPIDMTEEFRPNAYVSATVIQPVKSDAPWKMHRAFGVTRLRVENEDEKLLLKVDGPKEARPKTKVRIAVEVRNPTGEPVCNASVTLALVDEGILQLTDFSTPDPFEFFHQTRGLGVSGSDLYSELFPEIPALNPKSAVGGDGSGYNPRHLSPVSPQRIQNVALVSKILHSNSKGKVVAHFSLPEFSGSLRVMVIAHAGNLFGAMDQPMIVRSPLMFQTTLPRFVAMKDHFEMPITLFNHTGQKGSANLSIELKDEKAVLRFTNSSEKNSKSSLPLATESGYPLAGGRESGWSRETETMGRVREGGDLNPPSPNPSHLGRGILMENGGQVTLSIPLEAGEAMGTAHLYIEAELNGEKYTQELELPVRPPYPITSVGSDATVTPGHPMEIKIPEKWVSQTAQLNIRVFPFSTFNIVNALNYLNEYPHGCAEQTLSTAFPLIGLTKVGEKFFPDLFEKKYVTQRVDTTITRLIGMQTLDGGIAMWPGYREIWPWASVYAAHFLVEAESLGYEIPLDFRDRLFLYLQKLMKETSDNPDTLEIQAYACFVLAKAGKPERSIMTRLEELLKNPVVSEHEIYPSTRFYLALAWFYAGRRDLAMDLIPQDFARPRQSRELEGNIGSPIRDQSILAQALMELDPENAAIPKLIQEIAQAGDDKKWGSTQDYAFALMALGQYLEKVDMGEPFASCELGSDSEKILETKGGEALSWTSLNQDVIGKNFLVKIQGSEQAKGYISWTVTGVSKEAPKNEDHGISIRRKYLDQNGKPLSMNEIKSGDLIQVELDLETTITYDNLVIEDLLPAGFEIENPRFNTTAQLSNPDAVSAFVDSRVDIRDDRLVLYGKMSKGRATYTYLVRAITPGTFTIPPVRAQCMYDISINSLFGAGETLTISSKN